MLERPDGAVEDADIFARAVLLLLERRDKSAREVLTMFASVDPVAAPIFLTSDEPVRREPAKMEPLDNLIRARVYTRDGWRCRYCARKLIVPGVLELLTRIIPGFRGLLPGHHMPFAKTERAVERVYPNVDHVHAVAAGGAWLDADNHVTACTPCNAKKSDKPGWRPGSIQRDDWDGLTSSYRALADRGGPIGAYHLKWFNALGL